MRISGKLGNNRDNPRLFVGRGNKKVDHKSSGNKKEEEDRIDQVLNAIKWLKFSINRNDKDPSTDKPQYQGDFSRQNRLQHYPYNTQWKDGKPIMPQPMNATKKVTLDPL